MKTAPEQTTSVQRATTPTRSFFSQAASGSSFFAPTLIQPQLTINEPGDAYEQEADAMAERVMRMPFGAVGSSLPGGASTLQRQPFGISRLQRQELPEEEVLQTKPLFLQRKCAACEEENKVQTKLQSSPPSNLQRKCAACAAEEQDSLQTMPLLRKATGGGYTAPPQLSTQLSQSKGGGQPLSPGVHSWMSTAFGTDFSGVRVHTDPQAQTMSQSIQAKAFTHGNDVYFNRGEYNPESGEGRKLLAHELTHVVQQGDTARNKIQKTIGDGDDLTSDRFAGNLKLEATLDGERYVKIGDSGKHLVEIQKALIDDLTYDPDGDPLPKFMIDEKFGKETKAAVIRYQKKYKAKREIIDVDGIIGPETMRHLDRRFGGAASQASKIHTIKDYISMWEAKTGRKMTDAERMILARGCIGITVINLGSGGPPNPPEDHCYSTFMRAREVANNMNAFMQSQGITNKRAQIYSIRFWSDGKDYKPDANGKVDMSGWAALSRPDCKKEIGVDCINFDYGFYDPFTNMWWHANHCEQIKDATNKVINPNCNFVDEKMEVYESTLGHYSRPLHDFDKQVFCVGVSNLK